MAGENGIETTQDGPADPAPAPALGEEEGPFEGEAGTPFRSPVSARAPLAAQAVLT